MAMRSLTVSRLVGRVIRRQVCVQEICSKSIIPVAMVVSRSSSSASNNELLNALKHEIDAEKQLERENLRGEKVPMISGFETKTDGANVHLVKMHGNERINVYFNVNHSVDMDGEDTDDEPVPLALPSLTVEITKGEERLCFYLDLCENETTELSQRFDFRVAEFYIAPSAKNEADDEIPDSIYSSSGKYIDPTLHDLLFNNYLAERGFDQKFCQEVVDFATHYEHSQYVTLLTKIQSFLLR